MKCERCGGDWGMHDGLQTIVKWNRRLEQLCRDLGFEILEPLEPTAPAMEPLTGLKCFALPGGPVFLR